MIFIFFFFFLLFFSFLFLLFSLSLFPPPPLLFPLFFSHLLFSPPSSPPIVPPPPSQKKLGIAGGIVGTKSFASKKYGDGPIHPSAPGLAGKALFYATCINAVLATGTVYGVSKSLEVNNVCCFVFVLFCFVLFCCWGEGLGVNHFFDYYFYFCFCYLLYCYFVFVRLLLCFSSIVLF